MGNVGRFRVIQIAAVAGSLGIRTARALSTQELPLLKLSPVQSTSLLTSFWRSVETERICPDRPPLIHDEPAGVLISNLLGPDIQEEWMASPVLEIGVDVLAVRTRAIDDWVEDDRQLQEQLGKRSAKVVLQRQVVNLGAGMCARPYRLDPGTFQPEIKVRWFEVDDLNLLATKRSVLEGGGFVANVHPPGEIQVVAGDVSDVQQLAKSLASAGLDPSLPTDWILEGLLEYLDPSSDHGPIFDMARKTGGAVGSRIIMQVLEPSTLEYFESIGFDVPYQDLVPSVDIVDKLERCGWSNVRVRREKDFVEAYGRSPTLPGFCLVDASIDA